MQQMLLKTTYLQFCSYHFLDQNKLLQIVTNIIVIQKLFSVLPIKNGFSTYFKLDLLNPYK